MSIRRHNPEAEAAERSAIFHGHPPEEIFQFKTRVHDHEWVSGMGKLERLFILNLDGEEVELDSFRGARLTQNEKGTQIMITGGDQSVEIEDFGIDREPHELELLGTLARVWYYTTKTHLRPEDGGTAIYDHEFGGRGRRRPVVMYDVLNRLLSVVGGDYTILPEGILD